MLQKLPRTADIDMTSAPRTRLGNMGAKSFPFFAAVAHPVTGDVHLPIYARREDHEKTSERRDEDGVTPTQGAG